MVQLNESLKLNHTLATWLLTTHACYLQSRVFKLGAKSHSGLRLCGIFYKGMPCHLKASYMLQAFIVIIAYDRIQLCVAKSECTT